MQTSVNRKRQRLVSNKEGAKDERPEHEGAPRPSLPANSSASVSTVDGRDDFTAYAAQDVGSGDTDGVYGIALPQIMWML